MKKKLRRIASVLLSVVMLVTLCSCMSMESGLEFIDENTVKVYTQVLMEEDSLESLGMTKEDYLDSISNSESSEEYEGWESETVEVEVDGKNHIGTRYYKDVTYETASFEGVDSGDCDIDVSVERNGSDVTVTVTYKNTGSLSIDEVNEVSQYIADGMMTTSFRIAVPEDCDVVSTNGDYNKEKKEITWDVLSVMSGTESEKVLTVTFNKPLTEAGIIFVDKETIKAYTQILVDESILSSTGMTKEEYIGSITEDMDDWETEELETEIMGKKYIGIRYFKTVEYKTGTYDELFDDTEVILGKNGSEESLQLETDELDINAFRVIFLENYKVISSNGVHNEETNEILWEDELSEGISVKFKKPLNILLIALIAFGIIAVVAIVVVVIVILGKKKTTLPVAPVYTPPVIPEQITAPAEEKEEAAAETAEVVEAAEETAEVVEAVAEATEEVKKFCYNCGTPVKESDAFCKNCGEPVIKQ